MISKPERLTSEHQLSGFKCGEPTLDEWLIKRAMRNQSIASATFVVCDKDRVVGYYCLSTGCVTHSAASGKLKRNMPDPIPVLVLGRLAVDVHYKAMNIGSGLLQDAILRSNRVQQDVGCRALLVHALHDNAAAFYLNYGFKMFPSDRHTLYIPLPIIMEDKHQT